MKPDTRLLYLDWVRGLAAIVMLQGHVFDSFLRNNLKTGGPFLFSQFLGGMPPAIFLFLTGVTLAFMMDSQERKGIPASGRVLRALRRAGYLFLVAFLFRIQLWAFSSPRNPWTEIFRVDILNCMGFAIAAMSLMAIFKTTERVRLCAVLGICIAAAAPFITQIDWSYAPALVKDYLAPNRLYFGFFPWAAFVAFGISAGSLLRTVDREHIPLAMQWIAIAGVALAFGGHAISDMSYSIYPRSDFWLDSPCLIFIKLGVILLLLPLAYLWTRPAQGWSWVRQMGVTSLLVYWVHIELVYGRWFGFFKETLTVEQTVLAVFCLVLLMLLLSLLRSNWRNWRKAVAWFEPAQPGRVSGD